METTPNLTKKRKRWVKQFKPEMLKGKPLPLNAAIQIRYSNALVALVKQMTQQTEREILRHLKSDNAQEYFAQDESVAVSSRVLTNKLKSKFTQLFGSKGPLMATEMLDATNKNSSKVLHESLKELSGGLSLGTRVFNDDMQEIMTASIAENVSYIKSIPAQYYTDIEGAVMRSITTGNGLQDLVPFFKKHEEITIKRARLIAHDQYRKAYANINANRMKSLGFDKYEWVHSGGAQDSRELHIDHDPIGLNGRICSLTDPPVIQHAKGSQPEIRGKPGDLINCLCIMRPIISFAENED